MSVATASVLEPVRATAGGRDWKQPEQWADAPPNSLSWLARPGELERMAWRNALLTLVTFGIYQFWGKVALRRRLWSAISLDGQRFAYTGAVRDALVPALMAGGVLLLVGGAIVAIKLFAIPTPRPRPSPWRLLVSIPLVFVIGLRLWRARAYLLTHTVWAGRSGALHGDAKPYALLHLATMLAMPLTAGWVLPWRQTAMARRMWDATELAGRRFTFAGSSSQLFWRLLPAWLGFIGIYLAAVLTIAFTMGPKIVRAHETWSMPALTMRDGGILITLACASLLAISALFAWYRAGQLRHLAQSLQLEGANLVLRMSTLAFVRLNVENMALKMLSLGLLAGLAEVRLVRHLVQGLVISAPTCPRH